MSTDTLFSLGLMSGTSLDGIDAALIRTDGRIITECGPALMVPYPQTLREKIYKALGMQTPFPELEHELTLLNGKAALTLLKKHNIPAKSVAIVGFHGQTLFHCPHERITNQLGDGQELANHLNIPVISSFRKADIAAGGQGAPLVPVFHAAMAQSLPKPLAILNIGGVSNVTWIGEHDELLAFDAGPGNALIDDWALRHIDQPMDCEGALAMKGQIHSHILHAFLKHPYFAAPPPKSLDRNTFQDTLSHLTQGLSAPDGAATLTACTIWAVVRAQAHFPSPPRCWLVCGGGRHNPQILEGLRCELSVKVNPVEAIGWDGDVLEAQAFAFLAVRSLKGLPLTYPTTTGVYKPLQGGILHYPL